MSVALLLDMAVATDPDRVAVVDGEHRLSVADLNDVAGRAAGYLHDCGARSVMYLGTGGAMLPVLLFAAAQAGLAFTPLNYRLAGEALTELIERLPTPIVVCDSAFAATVQSVSAPTVSTTEFLDRTQDFQIPEIVVDPDGAAVVLFTSGTTSRPKAVQLTHNNLTSYVTGTVEFGSAQPSEAALICVPPYHIAGVGTVLSNLYAGRKMVYLREFDALRWIRLVADECITTATVVPTMLDRIVSALDDHPVELPSLRNLAYGGSRVPLPLVRRAFELLPHVGLVNAYGLTETSSTIAVLTPEDHRTALTSTDEATRQRLGSVGRPVPSIEVDIRNDLGQPVPSGAVGELYVRGDQVSGTYAEIGSVLDDDGWFATRDLASQDSEGYLYVLGRADDTIIRGGENIAPSELEDVLVEHPDVREAAVVGVEDPQWGQALVAVVVPTPRATPDPDAMREFVRGRLRGSRTPDRIVFRDHLPTTPTGKVLRRQLSQELHTDLANS
jgi:acyl-CoA synthetase (AMP-forming)/AMP-acid ligase II